MDINQLYHDHQLTIMRAGRASDGSVRAAFTDDAARIARRIEGNLRLKRAPAARNWEQRYRSDDQPGQSWLRTLPRSVSVQ